MRVLVVNAGSRSVKLRLVEAGHGVLAEDLGPPDEGLEGQLADFVARAGAPDVVGHRVVHGGPSFTSPVLVDSEVRRSLGDLSDLAPLHNPPSLRGIDAARKLIPDAPSVACFDTAFHATIPPEASTYAVPVEWTARWGIRRYGFHGISCAWAVKRSAGLVGRPSESLRLIVCHLGGGASVTAVSGGASVDTSMGFTPLEGLVMATRSGDLDPGALLWMIERGMTAPEALDALEHRSGLLGLSGRSADMRELLAARDQGDTACTLAVAVYLHRLRAKVASMAAALGGADAMVFTGGVGENSPDVRAGACNLLGWMGVKLDESTNNGAADEDRDISAEGATVRTLVVHAREDLEIASQCEALLTD